MTHGGCTASRDDETKLKVVLVVLRRSRRRGGESMTAGTETREVKES